MALFARSVRSSIARESSRQSPTVTSCSVPPLTTKMVAARRKAAAFMVRPAGEASQRAPSSAKPSGSRSFAINGTRFCGACGLKIHSKLGRITSAQTSMSAQTRRLLDVDTPPWDLWGRAHASIGFHQSAFPAAFAPLASHRSCQVSPDCSDNQPSSRTIPSRRFCCVARPWSISNEAASMWASNRSLGCSVAGQVLAGPRGGNRSQSWRISGPIDGAATLITT